MRDISEHGLPSRPAREGERLLTYRFPNLQIALAPAIDVESGYGWAVERRPRGCWSAFSDGLRVRTKADPMSAVCLFPGAVLSMSHIPADLRRRLALRKLENVRFLQHVADRAFSRDRIRFSNGYEVFLQDLPEGVQFVLLSPIQEAQLIRLRMPFWPEALAA